MTNLNSYFLAAKASPLIDKNGNISMYWHNYFEQLNQYITKNLSPEGLQAPTQTTANIAVLNNQSSIGRLVYNTETDTPLINVAGTFKTIVTS